MKDTLVFYSGDTRVAATHPTATADENAFVAFKRRFFVPDREGGCWLLFERETGQGVAALIGPFKPHPKSARRLRNVHAPIGLAPVSLTLAPILVEFGVEALRWNGTAVEVRGQ